MQSAVDIARRAASAQSGIPYLDLAYATSTVGLDRRRVWVFTVSGSLRTVYAIATRNGGFDVKVRG